jgi:hypothetical protein
MGHIHANKVSASDVDELTCIQHDLEAEFALAPADVQVALREPKEQIVAYLVQLRTNLANKLSQQGSDEQMITPQMKMQEQQQCQWTADTAARRTKQPLPLAS